MHRFAVVVIKLALGVAALGLVLTGVAAAAPGKPSLYYVPPKVKPLNDGGVRVAFGWREVAFDNNGQQKFYTLYALDLSVACCSTSSVTVFGHGGDNDNHAAIDLTPGHRYRVTVRAQEGGTLGPASDPRDFDFDNVGPSVTNMTIPAGWVRTLTIPLFVLAAQPTDAMTYQVDMTSSGWPCPLGGGDPACPRSLTPESSIKTGRSNEELPGGDGIKYVWVRFRDDAQHTHTSRYPPPFSTLQGNPGPGSWRQVGLDTTAPVAKLASAAVSGVAGKPVELDATPSTDASSGVKADGYEWRWGDGSPNEAGKAGKFTHVYPGPGTYNGTVIVRDNAGTPTNANDTNFSSKTFTATIQPAPVNEPTPTPTPTPKPTPDPAPQPAPGPAPAPAPPADDRPREPKPDIALVELPRVAKGKAGPLASMQAPRSAAPARAFGVAFNLRDAATVKLTLRDSKNKVVASKSVRHGAGRFTSRLRAPEKPGRYRLVAKAGEKQLTLPITVARRG